MASIDDIISDIDNALEDDKDIDTYDWVLEADKIAKTQTREEINGMCDLLKGDRLVIPAFFGVDCQCNPKNVSAYAKEIDEGYGWGMFVECVNCKQQSTNSIPFELVGRKRVVASLAVCMRQTADGY